MGSSLALIGSEVSSSPDSGDSGRRVLAFTGLQLAAGPILATLVTRFVYFRRIRNKNILQIKNNDLFPIYNDLQLQ